MDVRVRPQNAGAVARAIKPDYALSSHVAALGIAFSAGETLSPAFASGALRPVGSNRVSRTRFMRPLWHKPDLPELPYVFEQVDLDPIARTDEKTHYGAGIVRYDPDTGEIAGNYWNDRKEEAGLNTAGTIRMARISRDRGERAA